MADHGNRPDLLVRRGTWAVIAATSLLLLATILLWQVAVNGIDPGFDEGGRDAATLGLFGVAGALGGVLRSLGYLLAIRNMSAREQRQWRLEAIVGPLLGVAAGMGAYFVMAAVFIRDVTDVNAAGQYLVSLAAGAAALSQFGKLVERGLVSSSLSRSGILGSESGSPTPILERLDSMLETRVADFLVVNFQGSVRARAEQVYGSFGEWDVEVVLTGEGDGEPPAAVPWSEHEEHDRSHETFHDRADLLITGGEDRPVVPFTLSVLSTDCEVTPLAISASVPAMGRSANLRFALTRRPHRGDDLPAHPPNSTTSVILQVSQGTQTIQVLRVLLLGSSGPS